jgi:LysM repeat protein
MFQRMMRWICSGLLGLALLVATVPATVRASSNAIVPSTPDADGGIVHIVGDGETLAGIAEAYGVSMDTIRALNGMDADSTIIYPGDRLIIKLAPTPTLTPTITPVPPRPTHTPTPVLPTRTPAPSRTPRPTLTATPTVNPLAATVGGFYDTHRQSLLVLMIAVCGVGLLWTLWSGFRKGA